MKNKFFPILLIAAICFSCITVNGANVNDIEKKIAAEKEKRKETQQKINEKNTQIKNVTKEREQVESEINAIEDNMRNLQSVINDCQAEINVKQGELAIAQEKLKISQISFKERARAMYENGATSYLDIIFGSSSFGDFLRRITIVQSIINYDKNIVGNFTQARDTVANAKKVIEDKKASNQKAKNLLASEKTSLDEANAKRNSLITKLESDKDELARQYQASLDAEASLQNQLSKSLGKSKNTKYVGGALAWPVPAGGRISCPFGYRTDPKPGFHYGIDIAIASGNDIVASNGGTVLRTGDNKGGYGLFVVVDHGGGMATLYAHASKILVKPGQSVKRGETIALIGSTGWSTGPHLHFEVIKDGSRVNPMSYLQ